MKRSNLSVCYALLSPLLAAALYVGLQSLIRALPAPPDNRLFFLGRSLAWALLTAVGALLSLSALPWTRREDRRPIPALLGLGILGLALFVAAQYLRYRLQWGVAFSQTVLFASGILLGAAFLSSKRRGKGKTALALSSPFLLLLFVEAAGYLVMRTGTPLGRPVGGLLAMAGYLCVSGLGAAGVACSDISRAPLGKGTIYSVRAVGLVAAFISLYWLLRSAWSLMSPDNPLPVTAVDGFLSSYPGIIPLSFGFAVRGAGGFAVGAHGGPRFAADHRSVLIDLRPSGKQGLIALL